MNDRIGNMNQGDPNRSGVKNAAHDKGLFQSTVPLWHRGETNYLCSNLTANAGVLPNGTLGAILRIPVDRHHYYSLLAYKEPVEHNFVSVGNRTLRSIRLSLRDHSGNLVPLEEGYEWSAQLQFGFPSN